MQNIRCTILTCALFLPTHVKHNYDTSYKYISLKRKQGTWVEYVLIGIFLKINISVLYRLYNPYGTILFEEIIIYKSFKYLLLPLLFLITTIVILVLADISVIITIR